MRTRAFQREEDLVTLSVEPFDSRDADGAPAYDSPVNVKGRAVLKREVMTGPEGENVVITLTLWVPGDASYVPLHADRVTHDGSTYVVEFREEARQLRGRGVDHYKIMCRDEP